MARAQHILQLRQIKTACFPAWISFPFTLLHIISLLKIKRKGFLFSLFIFPASAHHGVQTHTRVGARVGAGLCKAGDSRQGGGPTLLSSSQL